MSNKKNLNTHVIAISSGKGGVGKSNVACNLGINLAEQGYKVCLFDADLNLANINILLGISPENTLEQVVSKDKTIQEIKTKGPKGLDIIAGASGITGFISLNEGQQQALLDALQTLETEYDYLIIDTAAGIDSTVLRFLHSSPYLILILTPEPTSITDAFSLVKILKKQNYEQKILVLVNQVTDVSMAKKIFKRFNAAVEQYIQLKVSLIGFIVADDSVKQAVLKQKPFLIQFPNSDASQCIQRIALRIDKALNSITSPTQVFSDFFKQMIDARPLYEEQTENFNEPYVQEYSTAKQVLGLIEQLSEEERNDLYGHINREELKPQEMIKPFEEEIKPFEEEIKPSEKESKAEDFSREGLEEAISLASQLAYRI